MKTKSFLNHNIILFTALVLMQLAAFHSAAQKTRTYCWVTFKSSSLERQGELIGSKGTSIQIHFFRDINQPDFSADISVSMIGKIRCDMEKKTGKTHVGAGILVGMGTGLIVGDIIGSASSYTPTYNNGPGIGNAIGNTIGNGLGEIANASYTSAGIALGALIGGVGGGVIGGISHSWVIQSQYNLQIDGNLSTYQNNKEKLKPYIVSGN